MIVNGLLSTALNSLICIIPVKIITTVPQLGKYAEKDEPAAVK